MIEEFDETAWLNGFLAGGGNLQAEGMDRIRNFVFLWNIFEDIAMGKKAEIGRLSAFAEQINVHIPFDIADFTDYINYFSNRYFNANGDKTYSIEGLKFRDNANDQTAKSLVEAVLSHQQQNPVEIMKAMLFIVYRFRNNLFHGEKQLVNIEGQVDNFIVANNLLKMVLKKMKTVGML